MLNKPTYAIITMVAMETLWLLGEKWLLWETQFFKTYIFKKNFSVRALIMKVQSNKKCVSIKATIKIYFLLLCQIRFYPRMK